MVNNEIIEVSKRLTVFLFFFLGERYLDALDHVVGQIFTGKIGDALGRDLRADEFVEQRAATVGAFRRYTRLCSMAIYFARQVVAFGKNDQSRTIAQPIRRFICLYGLS